ncbi:MAG: FAD-dependent oxidoreductase, partial [Marinoscillum sp.]
IYHWVKKAYDPPFNQYIMFDEEQSPSKSFQEFWNLFDQDIGNDKGLHLSEIISDFNNIYSLLEQGVALKQTGELIATYANNAVIYPLPGVREYFRLGSKYILQLEDQKNLLGLNKQYDPGVNLCYIGRVEQPTDYHKGIVEFEKGKDTEKTGVPNDKVKKPYLVPYECLISTGFTNFMVACRGAGFDQPTAASARLSKNMMGLGHATGYAAALTLAKFGILGQKLDVREVPQISEADVKRISAASERYSLDYPLEEHMRIAFGANSWSK